jgi:hypothetical protein
LDDVLLPLLRSCQIHTYHLIRHGQYWELAAANRR